MFILMLFIKVILGLFIIALILAFITAIFLLMTVWRCAACKGKFVLHGETPENENYQYCPACSAIIIKDGQGR